MAKYEIAATMIVRPFLTIEADSKEEAIQKLHDEDFDKDEFKETALPAGDIEATEIYLNDKRLESPGH